MHLTLSSLLLFVLTTTATPSTRHSLLPRSCKTFTASSAPFNTFGPPIRASAGFVCSSPGTSINAPLLGSTCNTTTNCRVGIPAGTLPDDPQLNITLPSSISNNSIFSLIEKAVPAFGSFDTDANTTFSRGTASFCIEKGAAIYITVQRGLVCVNGTLSSCDDEGLQEGTAIQACRVRYEDTSNHRWATMAFGMQNVTVQEATALADNPLPVSAAGGFRKENGLGLLVVMMFMAGLWVMN